MNLQMYLDTNNITKYGLSKLSGVPKTTINDICSGKSSISKCSAHTVQMIAKSLNCTMEFIMTLDCSDNGYNCKSGLPENKTYLENDLPDYLIEAINCMVCSWKIIDSGKKDYHWDLYWDELNADINAAETEQEISKEQAWYIREKYLRIKRGE